jgi:hypothetical protein
MPEHYIYLYHLSLLMQSPFVNSIIVKKLLFIHNIFFRGALILIKEYFKTRVFFVKLRNEINK